jgi:hypothetical protein
MHPPYDIASWRMQHVCRLIELPRIGDPRGDLTVIEGDRQIPFAIDSVRWRDRATAGDLPGCGERLVVALAGTFDVLAGPPDGAAERFTLSRPDEGLYVGPAVPVRIDGASSDAAWMVLSGSAR